MDDMRNKKIALKELHIKLDLSAEKALAAMKKSAPPQDSGKSAGSDLAQGVSELVIQSGSVAEPNRTPEQQEEWEKERRFRRAAGLPDPEA